MAFSLQLDLASSSETHTLAHLADSPPDLTSNPLANSRNEIVEVGSFVAINIVRIPSREVGEMAGKVGVDGEPEEEGDDGQGRPYGVDGL